MIHASPTTFAVIGVVATIGAPATPAAAHVASTALCAQVSGLGGELAYGTVQAKIEKWTRLPHDWDGDDGVPLGSETAKNAINVLALLRSHGVPTPKPYIAGDGEAGLRWATDRGFASVSFLADGHVVAFVRPTVGPTYSLDEPFSQLLPINTLIDQIRTVA